ncbi:MAG: flagellar biosynthetic protein FliR [Lachnospiraceae bacterium]|nr:flagellar biosynthetic protein FliR [Lachnospiraceae bacterium]
MLQNVDLSFPLEELEYYLLILTRVSMFVFAAPFFGRTEVSRSIKASFAVILSFLLFESISPHMYVQYSSILEYTSLVLVEAVTGLLIGLIAAVTMDIAAFAGQIVDTNIGFSMAAQIDPATQQNVTVTGHFYQYAFMLIFIVTGMHRYLMLALAESFQLIPLGKAVFDLDALYDSLLGFLADYVSLGFRIGLPIFCVALITSGLLGIMAKVSPQMNMFAIGMQLKAAMGLGILVLTVRLLPDAADLIFTEMRHMIVSMVQAMGGAA